MADARLCSCGRDGRAGKSGHTQQRKARRRIPAGEVGLHRRPFVTAHVEPVLTPECAHGCDDDIGREDKPARRAAGAVDLDDRGAAVETESARDSES